jgi:PKD repeat protein
MLPGCTKKKGNQPISFICPDTVVQGNAVNFYVSATDAKDLWWNFGDGVTATVNNWNYIANTHIFDTAGTLKVTLMVNDDSVHMFSKNIVVLPVCVFKYSGTPLPGDTIYFKMAHAQSPSTICIWDFGDGSTTTGFHPTHLYSASGTYNVNVRMSVAGVDPVSNAIAIYETPFYSHLFDKGKLLTMRTVEIQYIGGLLDTIVTSIDSTVTVSTVSPNVQYRDPTTILFSSSTILTFDPNNSWGNIAFFTGQSGWLFYDSAKDSIGAFFFSSTGWFGFRHLSSGAQPMEKTDTRIFMNSP